MPKLSFRPLDLAASLLALAACHSKAPEPSPPTVMATDPNAVATDWTVENPTEPAVPVQLPTS